ncbi:hypothetical protein MN608_10081 [Microdochium nivale]|nr:hypothetical protein MN608_10081 [Microdochium nivale]
MKVIYSSARRVVFYLGEPTRALDLLMEGPWLLQMSLRSVHRRSECKDGGGCR